MPLLSSRKILKDVNLIEDPVEIKIRQDFDAENGSFFGEQDPKTKKILKTAEEEAQRIIEAAQKKEEDLLTKAKAARDAFVEEARREGLAQGYQVGYEEGTKEADVLKEQAEDLLAQARQACRKLMLQAEPNLIEISLLIAEKILRRQVALEPEEIKTIVKGVLEENKAGETYYIYAHPSDSRILLDSLQELKATAHQGVALNIVPDKRISPGGCRLETETAYYDATLEGQLRELKKLLQVGGSHA